MALHNRANTPPCATACSPNNVKHGYVVHLATVITTVKLLTQALSPKKPRPLLAPQKRYLGRYYDWQIDLLVQLKKRLGSPSP